MRALLGITLALLASTFLPAQTPAADAAPSQTARQALIEMFFGQSPDHLEKHLPDVTRRSLQELEGENGQGFLAGFSALAAQAKAGKEKFETFDTGSTLFTLETPGGGDYNKIEVTVERDSFTGAEDEIELALHLIRNGKDDEEALPVLPHFTFAMKIEAGVWRLDEINVSVRLPLTDPNFLKSLEKSRLRQNEQVAQWSMRSVISAEKSYQTASGGFACTLSALGKTGKETGAAHPAYLYDAQLVAGKKNGYNFSISECDGSHYQAVAEPAAPGSGQRAFCADESGTIRASADGKAASCVAGGEVVEKAPAGRTPSAGASPEVEAPNPTRDRTVNISQGVAQGLIVSKVQPVYPPEARTARIQGTVVLKARINKMGDIESLNLISGHPLLAPAAIDAVKQWKYRPYLLNGSAVDVNTQITVNFTLTGP